MIKSLLSTLPMIMFCLICVLKPDWMSRWGLKKSDPEMKRKTINIFIRIIGIIGIGFTAYSIFYTFILQQ